jgi:hypothetical protein
MATAGSKYCCKHQPAAEAPAAEAPGAEAPAAEEELYINLVEVLEDAMAGMEANAAEMADGVQEEGTERSDGPARRDCWRVGAGYSSAGGRIGGRTSTGRSSTGRSSGGIAGRSSNTGCSSAGLND